MAIVRSEILTPHETGIRGEDTVFVVVYSAVLFHDHKITPVNNYLMLLYSQISAPDRLDLPLVFTRQNF